MSHSAAGWAANYGDNMKVQLEDGVWLTDGEGDPPRTLVEEKAKEFKNTEEALKALTKAREFRPFETAQIHDELWYAAQRKAKLRPLIGQGR